MVTFNTPITLIVFNRPETTQKVLDVIESIRPQKLYVICDGPHKDKPQQEINVELVKKQILEFEKKAQSWGGKVIKHFSPENLGCKKNIILGLNWVFAQEEASIILEDDCVPNLDFFYFCQNMLDRYQSDWRVMMISGTNYLLDQLKTIDEDYFYSNYYAIWGWATWKRAWSLLDPQMKDWPNFKNQINEIYHCSYMSEAMTDFLNLVYDQKIDTWDGAWTYTCLINDAKAIVPKVNLVSNIGVVGLHTSADTKNHFKPVFDFKKSGSTYLEPKFKIAYRPYDIELFRTQFGPTLKGKVKKWVKSFLR